MSEQALAPELAQALDRAQRTLAALMGRTDEPWDDALAALELSCGQARAFFEGRQSVIEGLEAAVPNEDPRHYVLSEVRRGFDRCRSTLDAMLEAADTRNLPVLQGTIGALEESVEYLQECVGNLETIERESHTALPFPVLERLLGTVRGYKAQTTSADAVNAVLMAAVGMVAGLQRQIQLFGITHPQEQTLFQEAAHLTSEVAMGLGALAEGVASDASQAWTDGVECLTRACWPLAGLLREMDSVRSAPEFSTSAALEECYRYLQLQAAVRPRERDNLDRAVVERATAFCQLLQDHWQAYRQLPLAFVVADALERGKSLLSDLFKQLDVFGSRVGQADAGTMLSLCQLKDAADACRLTLHEVRIRLQDALARTEQFPRLELLRERLGRLLQKTMSVRRFLIDFSAQAAHLEHLRQQAHAGGMSGQQLAQVLEDQRRGFERISRYFDDPSPEHLIEGWRQVESTLPRLQSLRRALPTQRQKPQGLTETAPELLVRLTDWRHQVEQGTLSVREARGYVRREAGRLKELRQEANSRFRHLIKAGTSAAVQAAMQNHLDNIGMLLNALDSMESTLGSGNVQDGFDQARAAILAMEMELHQSR